MSYVLVTGSTKNIGRDICLALATEGYDIVAHYKFNFIEAKRLQKEIISLGRKCEIIRGDFSNKEGVKLFISSLIPRISIFKGLVNNASIYPLGSLEDSSLKDVENTFWVNFFSPFYLIQTLACNYMKEGGSIVNVGICGLNSNISTTHAPIYQMSKSSLLSLTRCAAKSFCQKDIRVNMVSPGYTDTSSDRPLDPAKLPMRRVAQSKEIASAVVFFFKNSYITGQNIEVAGGVRL